MAVIVETTLGDLTVDLFVEERPRACLNFLKLCKLKYYNYNLFHNVERDFIAQTGDPSGDGDGGESVWGVVEGSHKRYFEAESLPKIKHTIPGLVSLVSVGKNLVGSQFFFTLGSDLTSLDGIHCVIGEVAEGHDVLRKLNEAIVDDKYRPYQDIRITHTVILEDPFDDPRGFQVPNRSPSPSAERLKNGRIGADEDINDTDGKTEKEIHEILQEREAKARATILEIVGDLPDADIAPPENVLFVCKLNPVTTDDDLEIIFSRFGKVKSCEVIKDKYTGDSLQYAFVEFEDKKACENAYFKMDNVLIDDRRIHVDFSQSVAKVKWRGKGRGVVHQNSNKKIDFDNLGEDKKGRKRSPTLRDSRRDKNLERGKPKIQEPNIYRDREHRNYNRYKKPSNHERYIEDRRDTDRNRYKRKDETSERHERFIEDRRDGDRNRYSRKSEISERHRSRSPKHRSKDDTRNIHVDREKTRDKPEKSNERKRNKESKRNSRKNEKKSKSRKRKQRSSSASSNSNSEVRRKKQQKETRRRPSTSSNSSSSSD